MPDTFIADLRHYLTPHGELADMPVPARLIAQHLCSIVEAVTGRRPGYQRFDTNVWCRRRPNRRPCTGRIEAGFLERDPMHIGWRCPACGDNGIISGWQETEWDRTWS